jgi:hypothetical protein
MVMSRQIANDWLADCSKVFSLSRSYFIDFMRSCKFFSAALTLGRLQMQVKYPRAELRMILSQAMLFRTVSATTPAPQACTISCATFCGRHCLTHANAALKACGSNDEKKTSRRNFYSRNSVVYPRSSRKTRP